MKLTVFEHGKTAEAPPICLRLVQWGNEVDLRVVNAISGEHLTGGIIATIFPNGTMRLQSCMSPTLGLSLDSVGRIVTQ